MDFGIFLKRGNSSSHSRQQGASMLEFVVVFPIFLMFILGIFELSRYLYLKALVGHWTDNAVALAQIIPDLDAEPGPNDPPSIVAEIQERKAKAIKEIQDTAFNLATAGFVSAELGKGGAYLKSPPILELPTPKAGETMEEAMRYTPISVRMEIGIRPLVFKSMEFVVSRRVSGYREVRKLTALPIPVDCNGNADGSPNYNPIACITCPSLLMRPNTTSGNCECIDPARLTMNAAKTECVCLDSNKVYSGGNCVCASPLVPVTDQSLGNTTCQCRKGLTRGTDVNGNPTCSCNKTCSGTNIQLDSLSCECKCTSGPTLNDGNGGVTCGSCNYPEYWSGSSCECPNCDEPGYSPTGPNCECKKDCFLSCAAGTYPNSAKCICETCPQPCATGYAYQCSCIEPISSLPSPTGGGSDGGTDGGNINNGGDPISPVEGPTGETGGTGGGPIIIDDDE